MLVQYSSSLKFGITLNVYDKYSPVKRLTQSFRTCHRNYKSYPRLTEAVHVSQKSSSFHRSCNRFTCLLRTLVFNCYGMDGSRSKLLTILSRCMYVYVYIYVYIIICIYVYMSIYTYIYIYTHVCIYTCIYMYIYVCSVYIYENLAATHYTMAKTIVCHLFITILSFEFIIFTGGFYTVLFFYHVFIICHSLTFTSVSKVSFLCHLLLGL